MTPPDTRPDDMGFCGSDVEHCGWVDAPQDGRVGKPTGLSSTTEPQEGLGPSGFDPSRDAYVSELREMLLATVGGFERFERGFNWRTFRPKERAEAAVMDAVNVLEAAMAEIQEIGLPPEQQQQWLASAIKKWAAYQHAGARTLNWMITGPARFPVARNEKAMRVEAKRLDEYLDFAAHAIEWARRQQRQTERREIVAADASSGVQHKEKLFGDVRVVLNKALDRVQIIFPDRPSDSERRILKGRAFRWAPSVGAWQRQLTQNGVWAAEAAMREMGLSASDSDGSPKGRDREAGLDGAAATARAEGIAQERGA